jgi:hypothetical protein
MVLMPYDLFSWKNRKTTIRISMPVIRFIQIQLDQMVAHSVLADPPPSCLMWLFLLFLLHVVPVLARHQLLIFCPFWRLMPALTFSSHADPISLRSQAIVISMSGRGMAVAFGENWNLVFTFFVEATAKITPAGEKNYFHRVTFFLHILNCMTTP